MARPRLKDLPPAKRPHRVDRDTRREDGLVVFPTVADAQREDRYRLRALDRKEGLSRREAILAEDLRLRIKAAINRGEPPDTLAASEGYRTASLPLMSQAWKLQEENNYKPALITVRPQNMLIEIGDLSDVDPRRFKKMLANHLERGGVNKAGGFLYCQLDADVDLNRGREGVMDFHFHIFGCGEKVEALEALRSLRSFDNRRKNPLEWGLSESPRMLIQRDLEAMPTPLAYCSKSWFPHRPTTLLPNGKRDRSPRKMRIPSPYHERWLMWMDRWDLEDLILLSGLKVTRSGLKVVS